MGIGQNVTNFNQKNVKKKGAYFTVFCCLTVNLIALEWNKRLHPETEFFVAFLTDHFTSIKNHRTKTRRKKNNIWPQQEGHQVPV